MIALIDDGLPHLGRREDVAVLDGEEVGRDGEAAAAVFDLIVQKDAAVVLLGLAQDLLLELALHRLDRLGIDARIDDAGRSASPTKERTHFSRGWSD